MTTEEISSEFQAYADALLIPDSYKLTWTGLFGWYLESEDPPRFFRLTDRTFGDVGERTYENGDQPSDIDYWTGNCISRSIDEIIARKGRAVILDLACGPLAKAAYQIAERYGDKVHVHALDIVSSKNAYQRENLERRIGDAFTLPYADASLDLVYSFQFMVHLAPEERARVLDEVFRVMAPDSHAVLDIVDTIGYENGWLRRYDSLHSSEFFSYCNLMDFGLPLHTHWQHESGDGTIYTFRSVEEFKDSAPGWVTLNSGGLSPYLHIRKLVEKR